LLADVTAHALVSLADNRQQGGLYHVVAGGETSWHGYARFVIALAQAAGTALQAGADAVVPIGTADYPTPACRPLNSRLDTARFQNDFRLVLPHWQQGVRRLLAEWSR
jgi:dTDP-4-dehydrorhamnose reductase